MSYIGNEGCLKKSIKKIIEGYATLLFWDGDDKELGCKVKVNIDNLAEEIMKLITLV